MRRITSTVLLAILCVGNIARAQQPGTADDKSLPPSAPSTQPTQSDSKSKALTVIPLVIEQSDNSAGNRVNEFVGRKDVLKSASSAKPGKPFSTTVELKLPDDILNKEPAHTLHLSLSVFPPTKGAANLLIRKKQHADVFLFRRDINQINSVHPAIVHRKDGWIDVQFPLPALGRDTKSIVLELTGDSNSSEESFAYWAGFELHLASQVTYEEVDPTMQTLFQRYSDRGYGQLVDVATGKVLKSGIGIGWIGTDTTCLFSRDGSHVAIVSKVHEHPRSGSTDFEQLWLFSIRPFKQVQEAKSNRFRSIQFDQDNKTLLFKSDRGPEISGK